MRGWAAAPGCGILEAMSSLPQFDAQALAAMAPDELRALTAQLLARIEQDAQRAEQASQAIALRDAKIDKRKRPATPSPPGSPNSVFVSTPNDVDTNTLQFLLNSASAYACPAVGQ